MNNVIDLSVKRGQRGDRKVSDWLLANDMPRPTVDVLGKAFTEMNRLCNEPHPEAGMFNGIGFRRQTVEGQHVWEIGVEDIYPLQLVHDTSLTAEEIEYLYHGRVHGYEIHSYRRHDISHVMRPLFNHLSQMPGMEEDPPISPFLYFIREVIRQSHILLKPNLILAGYHAHSKAFMVILQRPGERFQWTVRYEDFLALPVSEALQSTG